MPGLVLSAGRMMENGDVFDWIQAKVIRTEPGPEVDKERRSHSQGAGAEGDTHGSRAQQPKGRRFSAGLILPSRGYFQVLEAGLIVTA